MPLYVSAKNSGTDFQPHPAGPYPARCTRVIDLGSQPTSFKGKPRLSRKVLICFQSSELMPDGEMKGKPYLVISKYTASLSQKALMRRDLEAWRGRRFTKIELEQFDLEHVLGKPALLNIVHSDPTEDGKVYANIQSIMTLPSSMTAPPATEPLLMFSLDSFDPAAYKSLSERLQEQIAKSPEYQAIVSGKPMPKLPAAGDGDGDGEDEDPDADIPF